MRFSRRGCVIGCVQIPRIGCRSCGLQHPGLQVRIGRTQRLSERTTLTLHIRRVSQHASKVCVRHVTHTFTTIPYRILRVIQPLFRKQKGGYRGQLSVAEETQLRKMSWLYECFLLINTQPFVSFPCRFVCTLRRQKLKSWWLKIREIESLAALRCTKMDESLKPLLRCSTVSYLQIKMVNSTDADVPCDVHCYCP